MIKPLVKLVKDKYDLYQFNESDSVIVVNDDQSYCHSRVMIEELKNNNFNKQLRVVIKNDSYSKLYQDLEDLGDLVTVEKIEPRSIFKSEFEFRLPDDISSRFLIDNSLVAEVKNFNQIYNPNFDFKTNLLLYKLDLKEVKSLFNLEQLLISILENREQIKVLHQNQSLFEIFEERVLSQLDVNFNSLVVDLKRAIVDGDLDEYLDFLLASYIFSYYKKHHCKDFLSGLDFDYQNYLTYYQLGREELKEFYDRLYIEQEDFVKSISNYLKTKEDKVDIFAAQFEYSKYLDNISGYLEYELDYLLKNLLTDLATDGLDEYQLALLAKAESKFKPLFEFEQPLNNFRRVKKLFNLFNNLDDKLSKDNNFEQWSTFYRKDYLALDNKLEENKDIFKIIEKLSSKYQLDLSRVQNEVKNKLDQANHYYEKFLINNYNELCGSERQLGIYSRLGEIKELINYGTPVIMIVIDAMRWDIWQIISELFEEYGFTVLNKENEVSLAALPSVTSISRHALFAGMSYDQLQKHKVTQQFTHSIHDEEKHLQNYFSYAEVAFASGGKEDFKKLVAKQADLYSFIFTEGDEMFHGFKDIDRQLIEALFENQIKNIVKTIEKYDYLAQAKVVVTTDHGTVQISDHQSHNLSSNLKGYLKDNNLSINSHGRYLKISGSEFKPKLYEELQEYLLTEEADYWHIIDRERMQDYYLPTIDHQGENYFWLISKYGYYTGSSRGNYTHGGLSLSETIIPFAILEKRETDFTLPELRLGKLDLVVDKESELELILINNNSYPLRDINLSLDYFGVSKQIGLVNSNDLTKIKINLLPTTSGRIDEKVSLSFKIGSDNKEYNKQLSLTVEDSSKARIDKSLKDSRELL
ncbi:MAG: PglZ domain-containing protein [Bacillota bacterium]